MDLSQYRTISINKSPGFQLAYPDPEQLKKRWEAGQLSVFPYWGKIWASAYALCLFLEKQPHWIRDKKLLEIAAGLGLPSLFASRYASTVFCTDYQQDPLDYINESIRVNAIVNITTGILDWQAIPKNLHYDVLLLSDINYAPEAFPALEKMIHTFLQMQTTIILTSPQRLMAKAFIEKLQPYCIYQEEIGVAEDLGETRISLMVLQKIRTV